MPICISVFFKVFLQGLEVGVALFLLLFNVGIGDQADDYRDGGDGKHDNGEDDPEEFFHKYLYKYCIPASRVS